MTTDIAVIKASENVDWLLWMYGKNEEGVLDSMIASYDQADVLYADGWRTSPFDFETDEQLLNEPGYKDLVEDMAGRLNFILNFENINEEDTLREFIDKYLEIKVRKGARVNTIKQRIRKKLVEEELIEG